MKYMGSKDRIAAPIVVIIHSCLTALNSDTYIEPFVGGANVIDKVVCKNRTGSDLHYYLIELLKYVRDGGELPYTVSREEYVKVRESIKGKGVTFNEHGETVYADWYIGAVGFLASRLGRWFDGGICRYRC